MVGIMCQLPVDGFHHGMPLIADVDDGVQILLVECTQGIQTG